MTFWLRKSVVVVAIAAIAIASCYAPRFAHASMMFQGASDHAVHDEHDPISHATACHEGSDLDNFGGDETATDKACCAAACAASAFIFNAVQLPTPNHERPEAIPLVDQLRAFLPSALDPPPRAA